MFFKAKTVRHRLTFEKKTDFKKTVEISPEDNAASIDNDYAVWIITESGSG